jgi:hypothetical protein
MTTFRRLIISLLVVLAIWMFFSWPVPRYIGEGISSASLNVEKGATRAMIPGDHLQFLYQFWLTGDTIKGNTPLFINPYEFNVGNDADGAFFGTYYAPFSLFYTLGEALGGRAFGYNFNQLVTMWIMFLFTWLLVRRYSHDEWISLGAAVVGLSLPYSWITMFDGSPTGLTMMWVPIIFWALDIMIAERKLWAGAVAGIGICLAESDTHVFFFTMLAAPVWCGLSYLFHYPWQWPSRALCRSLLKAALPLVFFLGVAVWQIWYVRSSIQDTALATTTRSMEEIRAGSPLLSGMVRLSNIGEGRKIYVGGYLMVLLAAGAWMFWRARRRSWDSQKSPLIPVVLLGLGIIAVGLLATGVHNPGGSRAWKVVMTLIPPYGMIRQPHKIFCLMPVLIALAAGVLWPALLRGLSSRWRMVVLAAMVLPIVMDYGHRIHPTICLLDREQGAFKAIAEDAKAEGNQRPHLLSLPIWPGDSHFDSINEYYVSLYRLRMVNGYGGTVRKSYQDNIFQRLESMNVGSLSDEQLDFLLSRGVGYLVLHEDSFPEKVSPFPVGQVLEALRGHPRLKGIGSDGAIWAFKILLIPSGRAKPPAEPRVFEQVVSVKDPLPKYYFPARRFDFEELRKAVPFGMPPGTVTVPPSMTVLDLPLKWRIRARGIGSIRVSNVIGPFTNLPEQVKIDSPDWKWVGIALPAGSGVAGVGAVVAAADGSVELDSIILSAGEWKSPEPGSRLELSASDFFHAGFTRPDGRSVTLRANYEPSSIVFYGPKLPLDVGRYSIELVFESPASAGTLLGNFNIRWRGDEMDNWVPVVSGTRAVSEFDQKDNRAFFLAFNFQRAADMTIRKIILIRLE